MKTFTISPEITGGGDPYHTYTCEHAGEPFTTGRKQSLCHAARWLIQQGCPDQPWQSVTNEGQKELFGPSIQWLADHTLVESDRRGFSWKAYEPVPEGGIKRRTP